VPLSLADPRGPGVLPASPRSSTAAPRSHKTPHSVQRKDVTMSALNTAASDDGRAQVTLIIPVYKEEDNILLFFDEIARVIALPYRALVIYDDEDDTTLIHRERLQSSNPAIRFVRNIYGTGVVNAFKTGFELAETNYIIPIMCDLSDMPETVNRLYERIQEGYDLVVASRYAPGGRKIGGSKLKFVLSWLANHSLHWITGIPTHDMTNAFIIYRKEVLDEIYIQTTGGFEITMEIIAKAHVLGRRISEVPTVNRDRHAGKSNFKLARWILGYLHWYLYIVYFHFLHRLLKPYRENVTKIQRKSNPS
jgi:dolichol-phosphate mannosyltransferase